tara:strand:+ start:1909 stop:2121 length:213 start_codon:yes stop_codon:yes gene_type:complete
MNIEEVLERCDQSAWSGTSQEVFDQAHQDREFLAAKLKKIRAIASDYNSPVINSGLQNLAIKILDITGRW